MIKSCKILAGYPTKLPTIGSRRFSFKPGLNLLVGPNGSGKSTLLSCMAAYCGIKGGGISRPLKNGDIWFIHSEPQIPSGFSQLSPGESRVSLNWDGALTFFQSSRVSDATSFGWFFNSEEESTDGITTMEEQVSILTHKPSSGQLRLHKLTRLLGLLTQTEEQTYQALWQKAEKRAQQLGRSDQITAEHKRYWSGVRAKHPTKVPTLLLDEPDAGLAIHLQIALWICVLPKLLQKGFQIILTTHNPLILFSQLPMNVVSLTSDYPETMKLLLTAYTNGKLSPEQFTELATKLEEMSGATQ